MSSGESSSTSSTTDAATQAKPKYIVVSGAREEFWPMKNYIIVARYFAKQAAAGKFVLIEGECNGVDVQARRAAEQLGMEVIKMPAKWKIPGKDPNSKEMVYDRGGGPQTEYGDARAAHPET